MCLQIQPGQIQIQPDIARVRIEAFPQQVPCSDKISASDGSGGLLPGLLGLKSIQSPHLLLLVGIQLPEQLGRLPAMTLPNIDLDQGLTCS